MQPCFTPAKQVKASVNLLSILTADLSWTLLELTDALSSNGILWLSTLSSN